MSMKSRHKKPAIYIKRVENIEDEEWKTSPLFRSICDAMAYYAKNSPGGFRINVALDNGELLTKKFNEITWGKNAFKNRFSEDNTLVAVKILFSDGSVDYGLKYRNNKEIIHDRNAVLEPLYLKEGIWSEVERAFVECPPTTDSVRSIPAWLLKRLPMYNENIRDQVIANGGTRSAPTWKEALFSMMNSPMVERTRIPYGKPPSKHYKGDEMFAHKITYALDFSNARRDFHWWSGGMSMQEFHNYGQYNTICTSTKYDPMSQYEYFIVEESTNPGLVGKDIQEIRKVGDETTKLVVYVYRYIKSIYVNRTSKRNVYKVIPFGNILNIEKMEYYSDKNAIEIWNNLDQTVAGNV